VPADGGVSQAPTITTPAMTQAWMILGTAAYMAPEQARGKAGDERADIWAFGAVLFEMLVGQPAFRGEDVTDTLALVVRGDPGWDALPPVAPAEGVPSPDRGVFVEPFPLTGATYQVPKTRLDFHPTWAPSGREIFYVPTVLSDAIVAVGMQSAGSPAFGAPTPLKGVPPPGFVSTSQRGYDVLPDGGFLTLLPDEGGPVGGRPELRVILNWFDELKRLVPTN
jgi:serine/threonine protein kinase